MDIWFFYFNTVFVVRCSLLFKTFQTLTTMLNNLSVGVGWGGSVPLDLMFSSYIGPEAFCIPHNTVIFITILIAKTSDIFKFNCE